jgi:hypothetical protein
VVDGEVVELGFTFELGFVVVFGTVLGVLLGEFGAAFGVVLGVLGVTSGVAPGSVCMVEELGLVAVGGVSSPVSDSESFEFPWCPENWDCWTGRSSIPSWMIRS